MEQTEASELDHLRKLNAQLEKDIAHVIRHDQLTGLMNRTSFVTEVDQIMSKADYSTTNAAIIEIGISGIPRIAGSLGRHVADYVISALAARLNAIKDQNSLCCRLDYWSFAIFIPLIHDPLEALTTAKSVIEALSVPVDWVDRPLKMELGAGVALTVEGQHQAIELLEKAGLALKSATEKNGAGYAFFNPALAQIAMRRANVLQALQESADQHQFSLDYQPFYCTKTSELKGFEALMRMNHAVMGTISPAEFIPVAEESSLITKLGAWALAEACREATNWPSHLTVAVNISPEQFYSGNLITDVYNALELSSFPAYRLELEITEGTMLKDSEMVMSQLSSLRDMGCAIVLDDFGTGYSSLSYLWKFPFSKLKIDRSFVKALEDTHLVRGMLRSIIDLARNLGLKTTAEGIETPDHVAVLKEFKCDYIQGYLTGRPAAQTDLAAIILKNYSSQLRDQPEAARNSVAAMHTTLQAP
ncbi:MAG: GGDEF domain-containing protein [Alphaproteobacteria bacterium]|nr:GGDEF domain-containing protein [Alphaproteobacteria bacterium]